MNPDEIKKQVHALIESVLQRVFGGSIQETTLKTLVDEIDKLYTQK